MIKNGHMKFAEIITALKPDTQYVNSIGGLPTTEEDFNKIQWVVGVDGDSAILSTTNPHSEITWEKFKTKRDEIQTEYDSLAYARKRDAEYPPLKEFAEAYTEKEFGGDATKMDAYKIKYNKVRSDNPK